MKMKMTRSFSLLPLVVVVASLFLEVADASVSPSEFSQYWKDPDLILENLDDYQALWIRVHNCVWSECAIDDNDDDGEGRDGDENWYQARTQAFCANVAYSLYGIPKHNFALPLTQCSRGTYIDSFFTYGGADTLLHAIGKTEHQYFFENNENDGYNNNNNNNNWKNYNVDDDGAYNNNNQYKFTTTPNANCHVLADDDAYDWGGDGEDNNNNNNNNNQENDHQDRKLSGDGGDGGDDYTSGISSTMGCSADGHKFALAIFQGKTCDGNYFLDTTDLDQNIRKYNRELHVRCLRVWGRTFGNKDTIMALLLNSWSCDLDLYPNGCPDPYGIKQRHANALRAVGKNGQSGAKLAIWNGRLKLPLRILSWLLFTIGMLMMMITYYLKNKNRIKGKGVKGFAKALIEDYQAYRREQQELKLLKDEQKALEKEEKRKKKKERKKEKKERKKKKSKRWGRRSSYDDDDHDNNNNEDMDNNYDDEQLHGDHDDEGDIEMEGYVRSSSPVSSESFSPVANRDVINTFSAPSSPYSDEDEAYGGGGRRSSTKRTSRRREGETREERRERKKKSKSRREQRLTRSPDY